MTTLRIDSIVNTQGWVLRSNDYVSYGTRAKALFKRTKKGKVYFMAKSYEKNIGELRSEICASVVGRFYEFPVQKVWLCKVPQYQEAAVSLPSDLGALIQLDIRKQRVVKGKNITKFRDELRHISALINHVQPNFKLQSNNRATRRTSRHAYTLDIVVEALRAYVKEKSCPEIWDQFFELMAFDALIGSTDRHENNWGVLEKAENGSFLRLAPAFDNGISLLWNMEEQGRHFQRNSFGDRFVRAAKSALRKNHDSKYTLYEVLPVIFSLPEYKDSKAPEVLLGRLNKAGNLGRFFAAIPHTPDFKTTDDSLRVVQLYLERRRVLLKECLSKIISSQHANA